MRAKLSVFVVFMLLMIIFPTPAYGAILEVGGRYVGIIEYNEDMPLLLGPVVSISPGGVGKGIDILKMSTLYLTFDFLSKSNPRNEKTRNEEICIEDSYFLHLPLMLFKDIESNCISIKQVPYDNYLFVFKSNPYILSLTNAIFGEYTFHDVKDPLGLIREVESEDINVLKISGKPYNINLLAYLISADFDDDSGDKSYYGIMRSTYQFPSNLCLGFTYGIRQSLNELGVNMVPGKNTDNNISLDVKIPLTNISKQATLQGAFALSTGKKDNGPYHFKSAFSIKLRKLQLKNTTFIWDMIAVEPGFSALAAKKDSSDITKFEGKRYTKGEVKTSFNFFNKKTGITLTRESITNYDGSFDIEKGSSKKKISGEVEFRPFENTVLVTDMYLNEVLAQTGEYVGDYTMRSRVKVSYKLPVSTEIWGRVWQITKKHKASEGKGNRYECGIKINSLEYGQLKGKGGYEVGTLTFPGYTSVGQYTKKFYGEIYGELGHTYNPANINRIDLSLAGMAKYACRAKQDPKITLVGYGRLGIIINPRFTNNISVLFGKEPKINSHYASTLHNEFKWKISESTSFKLGYTFKKDRGTFDATYIMSLFGANLEIGYGKTGLCDECTDTGHIGKPWAWLCSAKVQPRSRLFTLTITVPF